MSENKIYIAKLKKGGKVFEIDIDPFEAQNFKQGKTTVKNAIKAEKIFSDAKKGMLASAKDMESLFGTSDVMEVAEIILKEGEVPTTTEQRHAIVDEKRKRIVNIIHTNAVDPRTHTPHPVARIEAALEEGKFRMDDNKSAEDQVEDALHAIRPILAIKFETKEIAVKIPAEYAAKSYGVVKTLGKMLREEWLNDGSLAVVIEIPGGMEEEMHNKLNGLCHGNVETKILNTK